METFLIETVYFFELNLPEQLLKYVRVAIISESIVNKTSDNFHTYSTDFIGHELDKVRSCYSFKKINNNKYVLAINIGIYCETISNDPIQLTFLISYINTSGSYELRKYKV
jgi:hypothetical protein